jgi:tetratricopeptide (TPR) repeat protein
MRSMQAQIHNTAIPGAQHTERSILKKRAGAGAVALLAVLALLACGPVSSPTGAPVPSRTAGTVSPAFDEGNQHYQKGAELAMSATQLSQGGETEKAQAEFERAQAEFEQAAASFQAVLDGAPDNVSAMANLAIIYYAMGRLDDAVAQYQRALEIAPEAADVHSNLAAAYVQSGQMEDALREYQAAVQFDPELAEAYFGLGVVYMQLDQSQEAIQAFVEFQKLDKGTDPYASQQAEQYLKQLGNP